MADKKDMSVEEILAAARAGSGGGDAEKPAEEETKTPTEERASNVLEAARDAAKTSKELVARANRLTQTKEQQKASSEMSVEEMLAAARGAKSAEEPAQETSAASDKKPSEMSVEEMMAAARGAKAAPKEKAKPKAAPKPKAAAKKEKAAPPASSGPKDTASILAEARKSVKPGPMSKAEAASQGKPAAKGKKKVEVPPMPVKPAYATPPQAAAEPETRRSFIEKLTFVTVGSPLIIGFVSLAVTNILWVLGLARYMFPNVLIEPPTRFKVGFPDDFAPGQVETKFKAQFGIWLVRYEYEGQAQIYALKSVCTHLGCTPNWLEGEQKFKCPCHGSGFYKDGVNFEGPAPRPLERYAISLADDGQLEVDKSRKFNEELGQWKDSASYVSV